MTKHPSLNAPFERPATITAAASMDPYAQCWCRSGKKYKFCHFRRERQPAINIFEEEQKLLSVIRDGYCSHPDQASDPCSGSISMAHTVQRGGGLTAISESGHVMTVKPTMKRLIEHEGRAPPRRIGIHKASVFPGFCNKHDNAIFQPIEGADIRLNWKNALLFAYRACPPSALIGQNGRIE